MGCAKWKRWGERDVSLACMPSNLPWLEACMYHNGRCDDRCSILNRLGIHHGLYKMACSCDDTATTLAYEDDTAHAETLRQVAGSACIIAPPEHTEGEFIFEGRVGEISTWMDWYTFRKVPLESPLALVFTFPLTLYHLLVKLRLVGPPSMARLQQRKPLRVHYLGVEGAEWNSLTCFRELALLLPHDSLEIDMVGDGIDGPAPGSAFRFKGRLGGYVTL